MIIFSSLKIHAVTAFFLVQTIFWTACSISVPGPKMPPTDVNVSETGPGSLLIEVVDYQAVPFASETYVQLTGIVVNNTGAGIQGVILTMTLHDSQGQPVAIAETYVAPTYLPANGQGRFEVVAMLKKTRNMAATRLVTVARRMSSY
ncbi:MAG: FxLYD domain-containing protein [Deltaproteobacteria bacterium]|jgi:hypothetical protein|nr:FxLYD domain-containing protein [Deltaproteobacteria bacterium]